MAVASAFLPVDAMVYRRKARQIRARYARQPGAMHQALRGLAERSDRKPWSQPSREPRRDAAVTAPSPASSVTSTLERGFADYISDRLSAGPFTYSDRMDALKSAERIGISRFRANLMVALAQHAAGAAADFDRPAKSTGTVWMLLFIVLATEVVVAGSLYLGLR